MINLLTTIAMILMLAAAFTKLFDLFVKDQTKDAIREKVESFWVLLDDRSPVIIIQAPLIFLAAAYNIIFGDRCFSKMAITRSLILSVALLIVSLGITGVFTGTHFSMKMFPWEYFDKMIKSEKVLYESCLNDPDRKNLFPNEYTRERWEYISQFNNTKWRVLYSGFFVIFVILVNAIFDTISFSVSRMMLNEMVQTKSLLLLLSVFFVNLFISVFVATIVLFSSMLLTMPSIAVTTVTSVIEVLLRYPSWTSVGLFAVGIGAWNLAGGWFKVLALMTILPSLVFCFAIFVSILINPIKKSAYNLIKTTILKAIQHDKGIFAFFTALFTTTGALVGGLVKLLGN